MPFNFENVGSVVQLSSLLVIRYYKSMFRADKSYFCQLGSYFIFCN